MVIRSPVCAVLGHVDHGKTLILDKIRGSAIQEKEAGGITQAIGASIIPTEVIKKICGKLLEDLKIKITTPGLLFIDTPGHAAFTNLRKRGGSIADIAVVVISINEGLMPQTQEAIDILKQSKTPFIIAANKIDLVSGWRAQKGSLLSNINSQTKEVQERFDTKLYELVGSLYELGFNAERFDRVSDYTKQIAMIPCSAMTGEGIPELLMILTGLAQRFLEGSLNIDAKGPAKGTILEIKEEKGLGKTLDVVIYEGSLKKGDTIVIGSIGEPIVTKVKALLEPAPLTEMREKGKFKQVDKVTAATGVKISALDIEGAIAGMPIRSAQKDLEKIKLEVQKEVNEVLIETDKTGIVVKADTLGSLEALVRLLKEKNIAIRVAAIGDISKKDISEAESSYEKEPLDSVVLGFNVKKIEESKKVKIITDQIIYKLIENFEKWRLEQQKKGRARELDSLTRPCKIEVLKGYIFRQSNPAIVGVEVLDGILKPNEDLINDKGKNITTLKSMQLEKESVNEAKKGQQVAASLDKVTVGRQINEGDILFSFIEESEFIKLKELKEYLEKPEIEILKEIAQIMRKDKPLWGV